MIYNKIPITIGEFQLITGPTVSFQYDVVQFLVFSGVTLPDYYTVDFCNEGDTRTIPIENSENGVRIPDEFLLTGRRIKAYIVVTGIDEGASETRFEITLPVRSRPGRSDIEPTPSEQLEIDSLIEALNNGVNRAEDAATAAEESETLAAGSATDAENSAENSEAWAIGERNGVPVPVGDVTYNNNSKFYANVAQQGAEESGFAWFDVNLQDGEMYVTITANLAEDVSFMVNETLGFLEVTVNG